MKFWVAQEEVSGHVETNANQKSLLKKCLEFKERGSTYQWIFYQVDVEISAETLMKFFRHKASWKDIPFVQGTFRVLEIADGKIVKPRPVKRPKFSGQIVKTLRDIK